MQATLFGILQMQKAGHADQRVAPQGPVRSVGFFARTHDVGWKALRKNGIRWRRGGHPAGSRAKARASNVIKDLLDLARALQVLLLPELIALVANQLDEGDQQSPLQQEHIKMKSFVPKQ